MGMPWKFTPAGTARAWLGGGGALLWFVLLCCAAGSQTSAAAETITGASLATCEPAPCEARTSLEHFALASVSNDDGTTTTREYGVYRPRHLSGPAPAMLVFYGNGPCGVTSSGRFSSLAVANRFLVVYMAVPPAALPCDRTWEKRDVDSTGTATPNDEPYVAAVVKDITRCPGECADPRRIYAAGMSSGGNMVADVMCDSANSPLFRGYMIDSSSLELFGGAPHCPSTNRNFFAMLALGNLGPDESFYYGRDVAKPHFDVPQFAEWASARLGCAGGLVQDRFGFPLPSTLSYAYRGPCEFASEGSVAVTTLGIEGGGHGWVCQDSDVQATPGKCAEQAVLGEDGLPQTNGLFAEEQFWDFLAAGSSRSQAPPDPEESTEPEEPAALGEQGKPSPGTGGPAPLTWPSGPPIAEMLGGSERRPWVALGDDYAAGPRDGRYTASDDAGASDCQPAKANYVSIAAHRLGIAPSLLSLHGCRGATVATFYRGDRRRHERPQLDWANASVGTVTLSVGWNDVAMADRVSLCERAPSHCASAWGSRFARSASSLQAPRGAGSLRSLLEALARAAPRAKIVALGYPHLFPSHPPRICHVGRSSKFAAAAMRAIDVGVQRLDRAIEAASTAAHVSFLAGSYDAFAGHELCTRRPYLNSAFEPDTGGQGALAGLLAGAIS